MAIKCIKKQKTPFTTDNVLQSWIESTYYVLVDIDNL